MMTLDEAIIHAEEIAKTCEMEVLERSNLPFSVVGYEDAKKRDLDRKRECASDHRQLAEWLRELKIHREIHDVLLQLLVDFDLDICCDDLMDNEEEQKICEENCDNKTKGCWVRWAKLKAREVNADDE